jgi:hypothetical protein
MALFHRMVASNLAMRSAGLAVRALILAVRAKAFKRELRICRARVHAHSLALFFPLLAPCVYSYTPSYLTKQLLVLHCLACLAWCCCYAGAAQACNECGRASNEEARLECDRGLDGWWRLTKGIRVKLTSHDATTTANSKTASKRRTTANSSMEGEVDQS